MGRIMEEVDVECEKMAIEEILVLCSDCIYPGADFDSLASTLRTLLLPGMRGSDARLPTLPPARALLAHPKRIRKAEFRFLESLNCAELRVVRALKKTHGTGGAHFYVHEIFPSGLEQPYIGSDAIPQQ